MNIMLVSDTHGNETHLRKALLRHRDIDALIHLGDFEGGRPYILELAGTLTDLGMDLPVYMVTGNCDRVGRSEVPAEQVVELAGHRLFLTHGHRYDVSYGDISRLAYRGEENHCDIICFGHIHQPVMTLLPGRTAAAPELLILNPGSISRPRQEGWQPTYLLLELSEGQTPAASLQYA